MTQQQLVNLRTARSPSCAGIDVAECNLVVLFDLKRNVKSFIQSRGRARHASSRLLVLASADGGDEDLLQEARLHFWRISFCGFRICGV